MAFKTVTKTSYGNRVGNAAKGMMVGVVMFLVGTGALFWNEGNYVKTKQAIEEAQAGTVRVDDVSSVKSDLNGKLIHATAKADTQDVLADEMFGVSTVAIALDRRVEYYQWEETKTTRTRDDSDGGQTTETEYHYNKKWVSKPIDSASFAKPAGHKNVAPVRIDAEKKYADNVAFGAYKLPKFFITQISNDVPAEIKPSEERVAKWEKAMGGTPQARARSASDADDDADDDADEESDADEDEASGGKSFVHMDPKKGTVYLGKSPGAPNIGDVRIAVMKTMPADVSIIAKTYGSTFEHFIASNGKEFSRLAMGAVSPEKMFQDAHDENSLITWIIRLVGIVFVVGGLKGIFGLLPAIMKRIPALGSIAEAGVGIICVVIGVAWSLMVIGIAWLFYRPLIGIPLMLVFVVGIVYLVKVSKQKKAAALAAAAAAPPLPGAAVPPPVNVEVPKDNTAT